MKLYGSQNKPDPSWSAPTSSDEVTPLKVHSNGIFEVITSRDVKVVGMRRSVRGVRHRGRRNSGNVADVSIGYGGTTAWKMCALTRNTTLAVFLKLRKTNQME